MLIDYFKIPFGEQLLIWTSRISLYGSCRTKPNKYDFVDKAFEKVGVYNGSTLLKPFLFLLKNKENFKIQPMCKRYLIDSEIDFIQCVDAFKYNSLKKKYFINLWSLEKELDEFIFYGSNLGRSFKNANLNTNIVISYDNIYQSKKTENIKTIH